MKKLFTLTAIAVVVTLIASAATRSKKAEISRNLDIFNSVYKELQTFYVDSIDSKKSITTAIDAMLDDIDPYTEYIPEDEQEEFRTLTTGEYGGIGSMIQETPEGVIISEPYEGSPALRAGLRAGDLILTIDGDSVKGWRSDKVSKHLKGESGTTINVTVKRPYAADSIRTFSFKREKIQIPSVPYFGMLPGEIGYVALSSFSEKSYKEVRDAVERLTKDGAKSIVFDLRGNGGGLVDAAVNILGIFLPKGTTVLTTKGKGLGAEKTYRTSVKPVSTKIPLVVMIDGGSASASEIVAGAIQDLDRGVVVGARSFGKGLVQSTREIPYNGLLKVTIAKYYIPSGRLIQAIDYSRRNPDGSVARIPDSLTTVFHTAAGREVRDGGGITPDVKIEYPDVNRLIYNLVRDNWIFNYATRYVASHPSLAAPSEFVVTDSIYADFKAFINPDKFNYDKVCETALAQLRKLTETEGYATDSVNAQLDILSGMLKHNLNRDLDLKRKGIEPYLTRELVTRYYHQAGEAEAALRFDNAVDSVKSILTSPTRYKEILTPKKIKK